VRRVLTPHVISEGDWNSDTFQPPATERSTHTHAHTRAPEHSRSDVRAPLYTGGGSDTVTQ
jgi:hypothetical protein